MSNMYIYFNLILDDFRYLQSVIVGSVCKLGMKDCVSRAKNKFAEWMADPSENKYVIAHIL